MEITLNNVPKSIHSTLTLKELLQDEGVGNQRGVAVAVNEEVVPAACWGDVRLRENDCVLVITATQGG